MSGCLRLELRLPGFTKTIEGMAGRIAAGLFFPGDIVDAGDRAGDVGTGELGKTEGPSECFPGGCTGVPQDGYPARFYPGAERPPGLACAIKVEQKQATGPVDTGHMEFGIGDDVGVCGPLGGAGRAAHGTGTAVRRFERDLFEPAVGVEDENATIDNRFRFSVL